MKVINLSSWAGRSFDLAHGVLLDMPEGMARDRMAAGLARLPTDEEIATLEITPFPVVTQSGSTRPILHLSNKGKRR